MVAACVVLSGCASDQGGGQVATTTSSAAAETPGNPWDLPLEQRPALFDPCAEIPVEAIEQGVGGAVEADERLTNHRPGDLFSCGWENDEVIFNFVGTWWSRDEFLADTELVEVDPQFEIAGRNGLRARTRGDNSSTSCYQVFFTSRGAVVATIDLVDSLNTFRGKRSLKACDVLEEAIVPVLDFIPEGDF